MGKCTVPVKVGGLLNIITSKVDNVFLTKRFTQSVRRKPNNCSATVLSA